MFKQLLAKLPRKYASKNESNSSDDVAALPSSINSANSLNSLAIGVLSSSLNSITRSSSFLNKLSTQNSGPSKSDGLNQEKKILSGNSLSDFGNMPPFDPHSYVPLISFHDVSYSEKQNLFIKKLKMCCVMFDFTDSSKNVKEKDVKLQTLQELVEYVTSSAKFSESMIREIIEMVAINLFRILPSTSHEIKHHEAIEGEEEFSMDPSWSHLQIVYEFLLRVVTSSELDTKIAKKYIDHSFVLRLLDLFNSGDQRERDCLKTILHRIYGKFMVHRYFIRKAINNIFYSFIFEGDHHNGIAELLEILGSVINGFALPLKEEHKLFLFRALIPLHKPRCLSLYHQQLSYCITQFVEKDVKLADMVIRGLLKYWPVTNSSKEVMFLCELEEVLELTQRDEFERCMGPLFQQIACCLNSSHFQVAERALFLWNNGYIQNMISQNQKIILPIIFPALERNTRSHWNRTIQNLTLNVKKSFSDSDPEFFENCLLKFEENEKKEKELMEKRELMWKRLEDAASSKVLGNETLLVSQLVSSLSIVTPSPRVIMGN